MLGLLLALGLAAAAPKLAYKPDPKSQADVASVNLEMPRNPCFGLTRATVLLSSAKSDRRRIYALNVVIADTPAPQFITGAQGGGAPLPMVSIRNGDVACTEYQCPQGSAAVFTLGGIHPKAQDGTVTVEVRTSAGKGCDVAVGLDPAVFALLDAWADKLPQPKGG